MPLTRVTSEGIRDNTVRGRDIQDNGIPLSKLSSNGSNAGDVLYIDANENLIYKPLAIEDIENISFDPINADPGDVLTWNGAAWVSSAPTGGPGGGGASLLNDLLDVTVMSPVNSQVLQYDSGSGNWINSQLLYSQLVGAPTVPTVLGSLSDVDVTGVADGSTIKYNSSTGQWETGVDLDDVGAKELNELSDVTVSGPLLNHTLLYNGTEFVSREITKADISDFVESDYATAAQGLLADSSLQPGDDIDQLTNNAGFITSISGFNLSDLADVNSSAAIAGQVLKFNGSTWVPAADNEGGTGGSSTLSGLSDVILSSPATGEFLYYNGTTWTDKAIAKADISDFSDADYATAAQGLLASTATQPGDNISSLTNDAGYITSVPAIGLSGLTDVDTTGVTNGQVLKYNGTSWEPATDQSGSGGIALTDLSVTVNTPGTADLSYNNSTGEFAYTPPDLSSFLTAYTETSTLGDVTGRGATTTDQVTLNGGIALSAGNLLAPTSPNLITDDFGIKLRPSNNTGTNGPSLIVGYNDGIQIYPNTEDYLAGGNIAAPFYINGAGSNTSGVNPGPIVIVGGRNFADNTYGDITIGNSGGGSTLLRSTVNFNSATVVGLELTDLGIADGTNGQVLTTDGSGNFSFTTVSGGASTWGSITGTLSDQTDLQSALNGKANTVHTHVKADITDFVESDYATAAQGLLANTATQPGDNLSVFANDLGFITSLSLDGLTDVTTAGAISGQVLKFNGTNWEPSNDLTSVGGTGATQLSELNDVSFSSVATGDFLYYNGTTWTDKAIAKADISDFVESDYATAAQGLLADTATQPGDNISSFTNDAGFVTSAVQPGDNVSTLTNDAGYLTSVSLSLDGLSDVTTAGASTGQVLKFNGTTWEPDTDNSGSTTINSIDDINDVSITTPLTNEYLSYNGTTWVNNAITKSDITDFSDADYATAAQGLLADTATQPGDNISSFTNDSNFVSAGANISSFTNDAGYITTAPDVISDLSDVDTSGSTTGQSLVYNGTTWTAQTLSTGGASELNDLTDVTIGTPATNDFIYYNGSTWTHKDILKSDITDFSDADYATAVQGSTADSAVQPGDNVSLLANDAGYLTGIPAISLNDLTDVTTAGASTGQVLKFNGSAWTAAADNAGESNTASNLGSGEQIFATKSGVDFEFRTLVAGTNVSLTTLADSITVDATGEANTASNLGAGTGVFANKSANDLEFKSLVAGTNVTLSSDANTITINSTGGGASLENTTAAGVTLIVDPLADPVQFRRLSAGAGINLTENTGNIIVDTSLQNTTSAGEALIVNPLSSTIEFKRIQAGNGIVLTSTANEINVEANVDYADLNNTPTEFTPEAHTHVKADITDFSDADYATAAQGLLADTAVQPTDSINVLSDVNTAGVVNGDVLTWNGVAGAFEPETPTSGGASTLDGLTDVDTSTVAPSDGDVLVYNATDGEWQPAAPTGGGGSFTHEWAVLQYQSGNTISPSATTTSANCSVTTYDGSSANVTGFTFTGYNKPPVAINIYVQRVSVGTWTLLTVSDLIDTPVEIVDANGTTTNPDLIDFNSPFNQEITMGLPITNTGADNAGLPVRYAKLIVNFTFAG